MAESIKDKVAIVGMDCTRFGELWDRRATDLLVMLLMKLTRMPVLITRTYCICDIPSS